MSYLSIRYSKPLILLFVLAIVFMLLPTFFAPKPRSFLFDDVCSIEDLTSCTGEEDLSSVDSRLDGIQVDMGNIIRNIRQSIESSARSFDENYYSTELGFNIQYQPLSKYRQHLQDVWEQHFASSSSSPSSSISSNAAITSEKVLSHLSIIPSSSSNDPIPSSIYTTSLEDPNDLPEQFKSWTSNNADWNVRFVDDQGIDAWLEDILPASKVVEAMRWLKDDGRWGVVRSDLFRYLVLLLDGGVYTDTDTACIRPISQWGDSAVKHHADSPLIEALPQLLSLSKSAGRTDPEIAGVEEDDSPSLIIALENDSPASGSDWEADTFVRGLQVVQWTMAAKKGHPILLDVIAHALNKVDELRIARKSGLVIDEEQDILEWSGPGALCARHTLIPEYEWTKAPMRYSDISYSDTVFTRNRLQD
uniref:Alpha-1,6-mannosyltransferase n=1 Tax=Kwoniella dejecticola CBS 10117 TaxID=1296121 RepID=A0A1A6A302_9TREE|nr:uncharacterized protein I303_05292 [Kwoniella dejecticola CBS 10117]OBR84434.1 hypothetical protein I303_05292 [Kwoniella dejecticola CBS 10117]